MEIKTEWDFLPLLEKDFEKERKEIEQAHLDFNKKWFGNKDYLEKLEVLKEALNDYESLVRNFSGAGNQGYYYELRQYQNENDIESRSKSGQISDFINEMKKKKIFFVLSLSKIPKDKQEEILKSELLKEYKNFLRNIFENSKYYLEENEENILSLKSNPSYELWTKMTSSLLSKETREVLDESLGKVEKNYTEMISLMQSPKQEVRDSSAKALNEILDKYVEVAEFELNAILEDKKINDNLRGFSRPDESRHKADLIETEIVDSLVESVSSKGFEISKKFYELKSKLLGLKKLNYYERAAEYGKIKKDFSYKEAAELVRKVLYKLDKKFGDIFEMYLKKGQIDTFPRKGKRGGACCTHHRIKDPTYILLNHTDSLRDVTVIAHEVGHGINNELMKEKQNSLYFGTPKSTAEVASTFMEDFVLAELLKEVTDEEKLIILLRKLEDDVSSIMRQIGLYNFEMEIHNKYRKENYLSKEKIGEIFRKNMENYMGEFVDCSKAENWWVYWPHIRYYFYVYSYSSGLLISKAMQKRVKENPEFIEKVKVFLSAGTSKSPKEIFLDLGIDISKKEFWEKGLQEVEDLLKETEKLAIKLGKI